MDTLGELGQHSTMEPTNQVSTSAIWASLIAQSVKNLPATQETQVQFLGWEDPLEKGIATHSSILARRIPRTESGGLWSIESQRVQHD